jgi:hypothetical protein
MAKGNGKLNGELDEYLVQHAEKLRTHERVLTGQIPRDTDLVDPAIDPDRYYDGDDDVMPTGHRMHRMPLHTFFS